MPNHGDYDPAKGWYSHVTKAWHRTPDKIGTVTPKYVPTDADRDEFQRLNARTFKPQPQMERLIALRDSDRADDRAKFEKIAKGGTRVTLHDYEAAKAKAEGGDQ